MQSKSPSIEIMRLHSTLERLQRTPFSAQDQIVSEIKQVVGSIYGSDSNEYKSINKFKLIDIDVSGKKKKFAPLFFSTWELIQKRELSETLFLYIKELERRNKTPHLL